MNQKTTRKNMSYRVLIGELLLCLFMFGTIFLLFLSIRADAEELPDNDAKQVETVFTDGLYISPSKTCRPTGGYIYINHKNQPGYMWRQFKDYFAASSDNMKKKLTPSVTDKTGSSLFYLPKWQKGNGR